MDTLAQELYHEEQRAGLIDLNKQVSELQKLLVRQYELYRLENKKTLLVKGDVSVSNQRDSIEISNLEGVLDSLSSLEKSLSVAITKNKPSKLEVSNIQDARQKTIEVNNLDELKKYFREITKAVTDNQPIVNITKQEVVFPSSPSKPVAVRLSDGRSFYKAIAQAAGARGYVILRYNKHHKPAAKLSTMVGVATQIKKLEMFRVFTTTMIGVATSSRYVRTIAKVATMIGVASTARLVLLQAKVATMVGNAIAVQNYVRLAAKVATMVGVATSTKALEMFRSFSATMVGVASSSKSLILVRQFTATMIGVASTAIQMPQTALNRITGGGTTVINKIFSILD